MLDKIVVQKRALMLLPLTADLRHSLHDVIIFCHFSVRYRIAIFCWKIRTGFWWDWSNNFEEIYYWLRDQTKLLQLMTVITRNMNKRKKETWTRERKKERKTRPWKVWQIRPNCHEKNWNKKEKMNNNNSKNLLVAYHNAPLTIYVKQLMFWLEQDH